MEKSTLLSTPFTTEKVTGDMHVVNWNQYAGKWSHLKDIQFPAIVSKPSVDILIGLDYADLHYSVQDVRGEKNEPIAGSHHLVGHASEFHKTTSYVNELISIELTYREMTNI